MTTTVRRIRPEEGALLRDVRLRALADSPTAFAVGHAEEAAYPTGYWEQAARDRAGSDHEATFFSESDGAVSGLVGGHLSGDGWFQLVSMWVAPEARERGAATRLTESVVELAVRAGAPGIYLWVNERNLPAIRLYRRCGFEFDGRSQPLPPHPGEIERRMVLLLGDPYPR